MIDEKAFAECLSEVFEKFDVKKLSTNEQGILGFNDEGEFNMSGVTITLNKPNWYVKEKLKK